MQYPLKNSDITVRDPFVVPFEGKYYMYATRSESCWSAMDGFDVYVSEDLENWSEHIEIYHREEGFFADQNYWAPECYVCNGKFYFIATLGCSDGRKKGIHMFTSDSPTGPFKFEGRLTPETEACIDGTLYAENGKTYVIFSHTLEDVPKGDMCAIELSDDLLSPAGNPFTLFSAADAKWNTIVPFAKDEFGIEGDAYFSDGPFFHRTVDGTLLCVWSSWGEGGYSVGIARSDNGSIFGSWSHDPEVVVADGGHGMLFRTFEGDLKYAMHRPNTFFHEHPYFAPVEEKNNTILIHA